MHRKKDIERKDIEIDTEINTQISNNIEYYNIHDLNAKYFLKLKFLKIFIKPIKIANFIGMIAVIRKKQNKYVYN